MVLANETSTVPCSQPNSAPAAMVRTAAPGNDAAATAT